MTAGLAHSLIDGRELRPCRRPVRPERNCQQDADAVVLLRRHVRVDSVGQGVRLGLGERAKQPVPEREDVAVVRVRQRLHVVVVYLVHIRRHKDPGQHTIEAFWQHKPQTLSLLEFHFLLPRPHNFLDLVEGSLVPYVDITPNRLGLIFLDEVHSSANVDRF